MAFNVLCDATVKKQKLILLNNFNLRFYFVNPPSFDFGYSFLLPALLAA